jgi:hypothetical protein
MPSTRLLNEAGRVMGAVFGVALLLLPAGCRRNQSAADPRAVLPLGPLTQAAQDFRLLACTKPLEVIPEYCSGEGVRAMDLAASQIGAEWENPDPEKVWKWFFQSSVIACTGLDSCTQLVAYYHPWADLFLLTEWRRAVGESPKVQRALVVCGDLVRNPENVSVPEPVPEWLRSEAIPPPLAVVLSTRRSVNAFLRLFANAFESENPTAWQGRLAPLAAPAGAARNAKAAGLLAAINLSGIQNLLDATEDAGLRDRFFSTVDLLEQGKSPELLPGGGAEELLEMLKRARGTWGAMGVVAAVPGRGGRAFVFASSPSTPSGFACFWLRSNAGAWELENLQFHSHQLSQKDIDSVGQSLKNEGLAP